MMKNNLAIQTNASEQEDSSLSVAYKKTNPTGTIAIESETRTTETIKPVGKPLVSKKKNEKGYHQLVPVNIYQKLEAIEEEIRPFIQGYQTVHLLQIISIVAWHIRKDEGVARLHKGYLEKTG